MKVKVNKFRSIGQIGVELPDGLTAVLGPNGTGKTNFAQAIIWALLGNAYYIASGKRVPVADLVKTGESNCSVKLDLSDFYVERFRENGFGRLETDLATDKFDSREKEHVLQEKIGIESISDVQTELFRSLYLNPNSSTLLAMTPDQRARHLLSLFQGAILEEIRAHFESEHRQTSAQIKAIGEMGLPEAMEKDTESLKAEITKLSELLTNVPNYRLEPSLTQQKSQQEASRDHYVARIAEIEKQLVALGSPSEERIKELQDLVKGKPHYREIGNQRAYLDVLAKRRQAFTDESLAVYQEKSDEIVNLLSKFHLLKETVFEVNGDEAMLQKLEQTKVLKEQECSRISQQKAAALVCPSCNADLMLHAGVLKTFDLAPLDEALAVYETELFELGQNLAAVQQSLLYQNLEKTIKEKEEAFAKLRTEYDEKQKYNEESISILEALIKEAIEAKPFYEELDKLQTIFTEATRLKAELNSCQNSLANTKASLAATEFDLTVLESHKEDFLKLENLEAELKAIEKENEIIQKARKLLDKKKTLEQKKPAIEWIVKHGLPGLVSRVILPRVTSLRHEINRVFDVLETPYKIDFEPLLNSDGMLAGVKTRCYSNMRWTSYDDIGSMAQQNLFRLAAILGERNLYGSKFKNIDDLLILDDPFSATYGDLAQALGRGIRKLLTGTVLVLTGYEHAAEFLYPDQVFETNMSSGETSLRLL
ncbi:MAG: hypothetical protein CV087_08440 [Candidatus Brocadia sp. WS118]|nr:MAG: hypothetical protein CV087_08440 [Candidatus Brocadia sp. WS118]